MWQPSLADGTRLLWYSLGPHGPQSLPFPLQVPRKVERHLHEAKCLPHWHRPGTRAGNMSSRWNPLEAVPSPVTRLFCGGGGSTRHSETPSPWDGGAWLDGGAVRLLWAETKVPSKPRERGLSRWSKGHLLRGFWTLAGIWGGCIFSAQGPAMVFPWGHQQVKQGAWVTWDHVSDPHLSFHVPESTRSPSYPMACLIDGAWRGQSWPRRRGKREQSQWP